MKKILRIFKRDVKYAVEALSPYLCMDTNETNLRARAMCKSLEYKEIGMVPCKFNGIDSVNLVLLKIYGK